MAKKVLGNSQIVRRIVRMFILDNPKADKPTYILFLKTLVDGRLKYSTRVKILPVNWKDARAFPSQPKYLKECTIINETLEKLQSTFDSAPKDKRTREHIRRLFDLALGYALPTREKTITDIVELIIQDREQGRELTKSGKVFSPGSTKNWRLTLRKLVEYETSKGVTLYFETFNMDSANNLLSYLNVKHQMSLSTLGRTIKELKAMFTAARLRGYFPNSTMDKVPNVKEDAFDIYLTEEKILKIYNVKTTEAKQKVKEWFVIDCFTGLRISDLSLLTKDKVHKGFIKLSNEKTGAKVVIPLHWTVQEILKKYRGHFPPVISDQKMNDYIKEIAEDAGLTEQHFYSMTIGGKRMDFKPLEWEMISNHTARRSFITNLLKAGFSESEVMKLAGIKDSKTLQKYNKVTHEEVAAKVASSAYFKKPS